MIKRIILALALVWTGAGAQQQGLFKDLWDNELINITEWEYLDGAWEKYRKGDYDNLRVNAVEWQGKECYIVSRNFREMARHHEGGSHYMPIYTFHYHMVYNGCVLYKDQLEELRNIEQGEIVRLEAVRRIPEYDIHDQASDGYEEFRSALLSEKPAADFEFFLWVQRTKRRKTDVVRITDRDDPAGFSRRYWEIPYDKFISLLTPGTGRIKGK